MASLRFLPPEPRPLGTGAFFDYVRCASRDEAKRIRAALGRRPVRRPSAAEQRWEGEGGYTPAA